MGFWSSLGGVISTVTGWAKEAARPIANVVKKVGAWMKDVGQITEAHVEGRNIFMEEESQYRRGPARRSRNHDFVWDAEDEKISARKDLLVTIEEQNSKIAVIDERSQKDHVQTKLKIEVIELIIASQTIERFAANIQLHEANLRIHHQGIQNSAGMLDAINRQRVGLKALFEQVNKIIFSINDAGINRYEATQIKGIDVDPRPGAISISNAYAAFEETVGLLNNETNEFVALTERQIERALHVRALAAEVPGKKRRIEDWIDRGVIPSLKNAKKSSVNLLRSLDEIPRIGDKEQLQAVVSQRGKIEEFED